VTVELFPKVTPTRIAFPLEVGDAKVALKELCAAPEISLFEAC